MATRQTQPRLRQSIRTRLLLLLIVLTSISVVTVAYLGVNSIQTVGRSAQEISGQALRTQAEEYLRQITVGDAERNDLILQRVQLDAGNVARYAATVFDNADHLMGGSLWPPDEHMFVGPDGQYMNGEADLSSVFVPVYAQVAPQVLRDIEVGAYLDMVLAPVFDNDPNSVAIYLGTENEVTRYYPNISLGLLVPPDFTVTQRPWYLSAAPDNNPGRAVVWSEVYADATGKGLLVTAAAPVYANDGEFIGVVGIDVTLGDITASVEETRLLGSGYSFMIDDVGRAVAMPSQGYLDILGRSAEPDEVGADVSQVGGDFAPVVAEMLAGESGFATLSASGRELLVAYAPLNVTGWSLANVVEADAVLQSVGALRTELASSTQSLVLARLLPAGGVILVVMVILGLLFTNRLAQPIRRIAEAAQQIGTGQWEAPLPPAGDDEIGVLSSAFHTMTRQLRQLLAGLEQQVTERTADLGRRTTQLEAAAQVAREAAAIRELDQLLNQTVDLISDQFGYYHAGIFLVDDANEFAILRAASSDGGQRMLARGHKLKVGEIGIVGFVAGRGEPRISLDVGEDAVFFDNPDLPYTRSEMALPLKVRDQVIGVLDVQSTEPEAFGAEDAAVLQTLADQVALAIQNARLLEESQDRIREISGLLGTYREDGARHWAAGRHRWGYTYDGVAVTPREGDLPDDSTPIRLPIRLRERTIGYLGLAFEGDSGTPEAIAMAQTIVDQASLALEGALLFQETRRQAARDQMVGEITARVGESLDLDAVLQTAAREIQRRLNLAWTEVRVGVPPLTSDNGNGA